MTEMVERVARALHAEQERTLASWSPIQKLPPFEDGRNVWEAQARAAIAAMREPTEAMIQAALTANSWQADGTARGMNKIRKKYRERMAAMIDAALVPNSDKS